MTHPRTHSDVIERAAYPDRHNCCLNVSHMHKPLSTPGPQTECPWKLSSCYYTAGIAGVLKFGLRKPHEVIAGVERRVMHDDQSDMKYNAYKGRLERKPYFSNRELKMRFGKPDPAVQRKLMLSGAPVQRTPQPRYTNFISSKPRMARREPKVVHRNVIKDMLRAKLKEAHSQKVRSESAIVPSFAINLVEDRERSGSDHVTHVVSETNSFSFTPATKAVSS